MMTFCSLATLHRIAFEGGWMKCVQELQALSFHSWDVYVMLNILVFVVVFLADSLGSWLLYRYAKSKEVL